MTMTDSITFQEVVAPAAAERRVSQTEFAGQLNSRFLLHADPDRTVSVELIGLSASPAAAGYEQFSLVFRAPVAMAPIQGAYATEHPVLGALRLFLVPVRQDADGLYFEAVFNRLIPAPSAEG